MYYSNGATLKNGSTYYHSNGGNLKSGSSCYYENGGSMGSCPTNYRIQAGLGNNDLEVIANLSTGEREGVSYSFTINGKMGSVTLGADGTIEDINYECGNSNDSQVQGLLDDYRSMTAEQQSKVRTGICR